MAAGAEDIVDEELDHEEINIALNLSEALQADEVEKFLVLYDSIPSSIATKRVDRIKEMARQLSALPKKQFELYRSKKVLTGDTSPLFCGCSLNLKGKLLTERSYVSDNAFVGLSCVALKKEAVQISPTLNRKDDALMDTLTEVSTTPRKKKKKKGKKNKSRDSTEPGKTVSSNDRSVDLTMSRMEEKLLDVASGKQISVRMNKDIVVDISTNCEDVITASAKDSAKVDASPQQKEEKNGNLCAAELCCDGDITDLSKDPPFGFPLCPEKIFMSALGLLPTSSINSTEHLTTNIQPLERTAEGSNTTDQRVSADVQSSSEVIEECISEEKPVKALLEHNAQSPETEAPTSFVVTETREELHNSLSSPPGEFMVEADSIDGDVSSSSAKEDEGWQSQTKRPYRKKKRELAARAGREKMQMERNQRRWEQRQQYEYTKKNNYHHHKKIVGDRDIPSCKEIEQEQGPCAKGSGNEHYVSDCVQPKTEYKDAACPQSIKEVRSSKSTAQKEDPISEKTFSYRDALLNSKAKPKDLENLYSSDSGVDANSVSSCESVVQPELPKQAPYNHEEVVNYLQKGWQGILEGTKKGLVSIYKEDAPPVARKWQTTRNQPKSVARVVR